MTEEYKEKFNYGFGEGVIMGKVEGYLMYVENNLKNGKTNYEEILSIADESTIARLMDYLPVRPKLWRRC